MQILAPADLLLNLNARDCFIPTDRLANLHGGQKASHFFNLFGDQSKQLCSPCRETTLITLLITSYWRYLKHKGKHIYFHNSITTDFCLYQFHVITGARRNAIGCGCPQNDVIPFELASRRLTIEMRVRPVWWPACVMSEWWGASDVIRHGFLNWKTVLWSLIYRVRRN